MSIRLFLRQQQRNLKRTLLNILLLTAAIAFFVMSLNLYQNSVQNLRNAEEAYSTIAVMELYGDVNRKGNLASIEDKDYAGYRAVGVDTYDISRIVSAPGVTDYDVRNRYGAYIPGIASLARKMTGNEEPSYDLMNGIDIIRFRVCGDEIYYLPIGEDAENYEGPAIRLDVLENASDSKRYSRTLFRFHALRWNEETVAQYANEIKQFNRSNTVEELILYPDTEYLMVIKDMNQWLPEERGSKVYISADKQYASDMSILFDQYGAEEYFVHYYPGGNVGTDEIGGEEIHQTAPFWRLEDIENDPKLKAYFERAWETVNYNQCAYTVTACESVMGVPAFHLGNAYLLEGRMIASNEYASGEKVCMIGKELANRQGWSVGDTLDMHFFPYNGFVNTEDDARLESPVYSQATAGFFDQGTYEIVGIYDQKEMIGSSEMDATTLALPWNTIFIPQASLTNVPSDADSHIHGSLFTIWLENNRVNDFLNEVDKLGITEEKSGRYQAKFTVYDQGYNAVQNGLQSMYSTAKLLLVLSALVLMVTCMLLSWFFAQNLKHSVGIFRMLGGSKGKAVAGVLFCACLVAITSGLCGTGIGYLLTKQVGTQIVEQSMMSKPWDTEFRFFLNDADMAKDGQAVFADLGLSLLAGLVGIGLFISLLLVFLAMYIHREPRELLPKSKA